MGGRLIPAGAGSTGTRRCRFGSFAAHPRWRGEHIKEMVEKGWVDGSSPLARGAQLLAFLAGDRVRLIPAGAGSTPSGCGAVHPALAHPRWRGEHQPSPHPITPASGSSPLARGARASPRGQGRPLRLIPAGAGSTACSKSLICVRSAHPRWRGEHTIAQPLMAGTSGSSPLARGAQPRRRRASDRPRLIPAGAGSTRMRGSIQAPWPAHPRWRGEHAQSVFNCVFATGSSPLARGALEVRRN